jgi:hypothetical protein
MKHCCIPGCPSNAQKSYTPIFSFPSNKVTLELWKKKIPLKTIKTGKNFGVCIKHFHSDFVIKEHRAKRPDGMYLFPQFIFF